jgi:hypothetical protein
VGSLALQQDNDSLWVLTDDSPLTWVTVLGTAAAHEVDAKTDYTAGDLDTEAEIISAFNTTNGKINSIIAKLEALGLLASP